MSEIPAPLWVDCDVTVERRSFIWMGEHTIIYDARYNRQHLEPIEDEL